MISIMMRAATSAIRLPMIVIRVVSTAVGAVSKETRSFSTEHSLHRRCRTRLVDDYRQSYKPSLFGQTTQPPLHCTEFVIQSLYSVKENTHLCAGMER